MVEFSHNVTREFTERKKTKKKTDKKLKQEVRSDCFDHVTMFVLHVRF